MGWIIRDRSWNFINCGMGTSQARATAEEAECESLLWVMQSSLIIGYKKITFEGDWKILIDVLHHKTQNLRLYPYLPMIRDWLQVLYRSKFSFTKREGKMCWCFSQGRNTIGKFRINFTTCPFIYQFYVCNNLNN